MSHRFKGLLVSPLCQTGFFTLGPEDRGTEYEKDDVVDD